MGHHIYAGLTPIQTTNPEPIGNQMESSKQRIPERSDEVGPSASG